MHSQTFLKKFRPFHVDGLKRMGHQFDGGYIVHYPSLKDADLLLNYGVGYKVDFEQEFYKETGKPTLAFDPTLYDISTFGHHLRGGFIQLLRQTKNLLKWVIKRPSLKNYKITFINEGLIEKDSGKYKSLATHFAEYDLYDKNIILKIDVEGAEYPVFNDPKVYGLLNNTIQVLMELHNIDQHLESLEYFMDNISKTHTLIHIHSNNHAGTFKMDGKNVPETLEVSFLLNKYVTWQEPTTDSYPLAGLDQPCNKSKPDLVLDFFY